MEVDWETEQPMSTGFHKMDSLLAGGLARGELLEIYGESGTGKTQVCMIITAHIARNRKDWSTVLYMDLKNDLLPSRLFDITKKDTMSMRRIRVIRESRAEDILEVLEHFDDEIAYGQTTFTDRLRLIVIDALPATVYPEMSTRNNGRTFQEELLQVVKRLSTNHGIAFVLVNNAVSSYERWTRCTTSRQIRMKPAMGKYWLHMPDFRIFLHRDSSFRSIIRASLEKSARTPINKSFDFTISDTGIE